MTPDRAADLIAEFVRRSKPSPIRLSAFPAQRAFLDDPAKMRAALCTRRSGKSYAAGIELFDGALTFPGTSQLYVALTRESAKRILYKDVLRHIDRKFNLGASFNETTLDVKLPNGSMIYLLGVDAKPDEAEKILGQKFKRVVVDECASYRQDLKALVTSVIRPALVDLDGTCTLIGTPGNVKGYFHDVTTGREPGWSVHRWSANDNPHVAVQWARELRELAAANPGIVDTPLFKQHYLGEWTIDTDALVYKYDRERNWVAAPPWGTDMRGVHVLLSLDLGYNDATAVTIAAYTDHDPNLYVLEAHKRVELTVSEVAAWVQGFMGRYELEQLIVDPASKQVVEELRQRYRMPLESAEKSGKVEAIAMMNSDMLTGRIKLVGAACDALIEEWQNLVWDERNGKRIENQACKNDLADSCNYAWRAARNYCATPAAPKPLPHSEEAIDEWWDAESARQESTARRPWWEKE